MNESKKGGVNATVEDAYWREHYVSPPYVAPGTQYEAYRPAYHFGWEGHGRYGELNWDAAEPRLRADWNSVGSQGGSRLDWEKAGPAARDAWLRLRDEADSRNDDAQGP